MVLQRYSFTSEGFAFPLLNAIFGSHASSSQENVQRSDCSTVSTLAPPSSKHTIMDEDDLDARSTAGEDELDLHSSS